jgi:cobalt-precorrin-5B (C1)-methyltransferase
MEDYVVVNGKRLRKGYTTGSCAAAAAKAAVLMLYSGNPISEVSIDTPAGVRLTLPVTDIRITADRVSCSVLKDGGDDPDVTTGLHVCAEASRKNSPGVEIRAGEGIGIVTLPGLKVEVGQPAINPAPLKMILNETQAVLKKGEGVAVTFSVPGGAEIARKTFNPKLGIVGGISIIGTSGIVNPMSEEALKESLALELGILAAKGERVALFAFGNYGERFADSMGLGKDKLVKVSNFVGFMLEKAVESGFKEVLIIGHLGKLIKVAAGIFQTHSRVADARMEIMTAYAALEGASTDILTKIYASSTTEAAAGIIKENGLGGVYDRVVANVSRRCVEYGHHRLKVGAVLFHEDQTLLAMDRNAKEILNEIGSNYGQ